MLEAATKVRIALRRQELRIPSVPVPEDGGKPRRLFRSKRNKLPLDVPKAPDDFAARDAAAAERPERGRVLYSARQAVPDRDNNVFGHELLFGSGPEHRHTAADPDWASATSLEQSAQVGLPDTTVRHACTVRLVGARTGCADLVVARGRVDARPSRQGQPPLQPPPAYGEGSILIQACHERRGDETH